MATKVKYFAGETELWDVHGLNNAKFAVQFPGVKGRKYDSFQRMVGYAVGADRKSPLLPVERKVEYKVQGASLHKCDARCLYATGRIMKCECSCGGKNHGRGAFNCEAAA